MNNLRSFLEYVNEKNEIMLWKLVTFKYFLSNQCLNFIKRTYINGCQRPFFKFIPTAKKTYESLFLTQLKQKGGKRRRSAMCSGLGFLQVFFFKKPHRVLGEFFNTKKKNYHNMKYVVTIFNQSWLANGTVI